LRHSLHQARFVSLLLPIGVKVCPSPANNRLIDSLPDLV
jgi:hypothetical protein